MNTAVQVETDDTGQSGSGRQLARFYACHCGDVIRPGITKSLAIVPVK